MHEHAVSFLCVIQFITIVDACLAQLCPFFVVRTYPTQLEIRPAPYPFIPPTASISIGTSKQRIEAERHGQQRRGQEIGHHILFGCPHVINM